MKSATTSVALDLRPAHAAARGLYPQHLQVPAVLGILPARSDGPGHGHRFHPRPVECADPHHRNRGGRERLSERDRGRISARRGDGDALPDAAGRQQSDQSQRRRRSGQYADHLRAAGGACRRDAAGLDRGVRRLRRRRRSELGRLQCLAVARRHLVQPDRHHQLSRRGRACYHSRRWRCYSGSNPDTADTLAVNLAESGGALVERQRDAMRRSATRFASSIPSLFPTRPRR